MSYTVFVAKLTKLRTLELGAVVCDEKLRHSFVGEERAKQVDGGFRRDMPGWKYFRPFAVSIDDDEIEFSVQRARIVSMNALPWSSCRWPRFWPGLWRRPCC